MAAAEFRFTIQGKKLLSGRFYGLAWRRSGKIDGAAEQRHLVELLLVHGIGTRVVVWRVLKISVYLYFAAIIGKVELASFFQ